MLKNKFIRYGSFIIAVLIGIGWYLYGDTLIKRGDLLYTPNDPMAVANDFWITALDEDSSAGIKYLSNGDYSLPLVPGYSELDRAILGEAEQNSGAYFIKTQLSLVRNGKNVLLPLYTVVVSENGKFKVDMTNTLSSIEDAALDNALSYYTSAVLAAKTVFNKSNLTDLEKKQLLDVNLNNLEQRMCEVRQSVIQSIDPSYHAIASTPAYCN